MNWFHPKISLKQWLEDAVRNSIEIPESSRKSCHDRRNALKSRAKLPSINQPWKNHENSKIVPVTTPDSNKAQSYDFWSLFEIPWHGNTWFTTFNLKKKLFWSSAKSPNPTQPKSKSPNQDFLPVLPTPNPTPEFPDSTSDFVVSHGKPPVKHVDMPNPRKSTRLATTWVVGRRFSGSFWGGMVYFQVRKC